MKPLWIHPYYSLAAKMSLLCTKSEVIIIVKSGIEYTQFWPLLPLSKKRCILYAWTNKPANFAVVTVEARVHCEGPLTALAQLLLMLMVDRVQRSSYDCHKGLLDILGLDSCYQRPSHRWLTEDWQTEPSSHVAIVPQYTASMPSSLYLTLVASHLLD